VWMTEWRAISARIAALLDTARFLLSTNVSDEITSAEILREKNGGDTAPARYILGAVRILGENAKDTGGILQRFFQSQATQLPDAPRACIRRFVEATRFGFGDPNHLAGMTAVIAAFASFRAEFEYLIADTEAVAKSLVVRAFTHLQSSIVADELVRNRWKQAFKHGETACERLGACHLLLHGIWAFKASTEGARTDLVLGETTWDEPSRVSQGLVLTEWKLVRGENTRLPKAREAYKQAKLYCQSPLAGFEVTSTRYIVLVSQERLEIPPAKIEGDVTYEFRNVAVAPKSPSQDARKTAKSKK
jgi:hypothetical protein